MEPSDYEARLGKLREEIDQIDGELLPLFLRRMDCSQRVAQLKKEAGMAVFAPQREQAILDRVRRRAGKEGEAAASLYSSIMAISRAKQHVLLQGGGPLRELEQTAARTLQRQGAREPFPTGRRWTSLDRSPLPLSRPSRESLRTWQRAGRTLACCLWRTPRPGLSPRCTT